MITVAGLGGVTPAYFPMRDWQLSQGVFIDEADIQSFGSVMVIRSTVAEALFPDEENPIGNRY